MTGQRARDLEAAYSHCLKKQILDQGSTLPCKDENFCCEVEELLKKEDGRDTHCLGLDTFNIMEESLRSAAADSKRVVKVRSGLRGLAKAFEVLEQATLNLYLSPWREEYKVVKMYSGIFTHCIKPVFSMQQIELLFGLVGYKKSSTQREQLHLQPQKVSAACLEELLRLSCAFFVARCECRLLLTSLGKYADQAQSELNVVKERQRGHCLEIAIDNAVRMIDVKQPLQELPEENDMDLYTDEHEDVSETAVDEAPHSLTWMLNKSVNGAPREPTYTSTYHRRAPEEDPASNDFSSISRYFSDYPKRAPGDKMDSLPEKTDHEFFCTCLEMKNTVLYKCTKCQTIHHQSCLNLEPCQRNHKTNVVRTDEIQAHLFEKQAAAAHEDSLSPSLNYCGGALSSLSLQERPESFRSYTSALSMHRSCETYSSDPQVVCYTCQVFHFDHCNDAKNCLDRHQTKHLGYCSAERCCQQTHVMCKFCGNEYCKECWYLNPIECICGKTFDHSSSV